METDQKRIIDRELNDIVNFLLRSDVKLDDMETGYIKTALSLCLVEGYLLALKSARQTVEEEINF